MINIKEQLDELLEVVREAGEAVIAVYNSGDMQIEAKDDNSPITKADTAAHTILASGISHLFQGVPVISEEGNEQENRQSLGSDMFWLVDPLDGTKEFIMRSDDFTICVALIKGGDPVFGVIAAPALGVTYYGGIDMGAYKIDSDNKAMPIHVKRNNPGILLRSRSNLNESTAAYINDNYHDYKVRIIGSQLKLSLIAEGRADVYPRVDSPLHLWDLAAGHAILLSAGGVVTRFDGSAIDYRNETFLVGDFIAKNH